MITEKNTPLMEQYFQIKVQHPDALLMFQVGDFYEMFFEDARLASAHLALTLTKRGKNKGEDIPLCGIPVHSLSHYLPKLIKGGFKVAICDQLTKPNPGTVVERGVTQVLSPGTLTDSLLLDEKSASYLLSFYPGADRWGLVFTELLTAQIFATTLPAGDFRSTESELIRFFPDEIILPADVNYQSFSSYFKKQGYYTSAAGLVIQDARKNEDIVGPDVSKLWLEKQFNQKVLGRLQSQGALTASLTNLYYYLQKNQASALEQFKTIQFYEQEDYLILDASTQKNLEIVGNNQDGSRKNSLFEILDCAKTPMGSRLVKKWLQRPLVQKNSILQRQEVVGALCQQIDTSKKLEDLLVQLSDVERIIGRISLGRATVLDYLGLKNSLNIVPQIKALLEKQLCFVPLAQSIKEKFADFSVLANLLTASINDSPDKKETIKDGFDEELDRLRSLLSGGQQEVLKLEQKEIARTGISSLKIRYNQVSGYYIEITNANLDSVPTDYTQQNTLVNRKRFVTQELKALERDLLRAQTEIESVEDAVFNKVKNEVTFYLGHLRQLAQSLAYLDALFSLAKMAYEHNYVLPHFNDDREIIINGGRHPIVEQKLNETFIKNDTRLTNQKSIWIITGPNMGGKSTYLRQVALICIMAQCGSFVPSESASLSILDRVFTRIGSGDNLAEGKSTFLVEMEETATICTAATNRSLVILDEVGRGTSTYDGMALAQAIIEYIVEKVGAKCLFATHYHELTRVSQRYAVVANYHLESRNTSNGVVFLHSVAEGVAGGSFGLEVAKLANLPLSIIQRASELLMEIDPNSKKNLSSTWHSAHSNQLLNNSEVYKEQLRIAQSRLASLEREVLVDKSINQILSQINLDTLSPKQAFDLVWEIKNLIS